MQGTHFLADNSSVFWSLVCYRCNYLQSCLSSESFGNLNNVQLEILPPTGFDRVRIQYFIFTVIYGAKNDHPRILEVSFRPKHQHYVHYKHSFDSVLVIWVHRHSAYMWRSNGAVFWRVIRIVRGSVSVPDPYPFGQFGFGYGC